MNEPLAAGQARDHSIPAMKRSAPRQLIASMLGLLMALALGLSAVHATDMTVKMSAAGTADMAPMAADCSSGCGGDDSMNEDPCVAVCPSAVAAVMTATGPIFTISAPVFSDISRTAPRGRSWHLDPPPPRPATLD